MNPSGSRRAFLAATLVGSIAVAACSSLEPARPAGNGGKASKSMTFMAGYKPQADVSFVGVYVAQEQGYFKDQALDVTIKHSSGQGEHAKLLAGKQVQVITEIGTDLVNHLTQENIPFTSLALLTQTSDAGLVTLAASGITEPKQFEGKTVGYKVIPTFEYLALLQKAGVDRSKIREVPVGFDPRVLTEKKVDVLPVFKSNEPDVLHRLGFAVNLIDPVRYGVDSLGQIWVAHRDLLAADPDPFVRFVTASLHGLDYAFAHPKDAIDIVMKYAPTEDRSHQEYMLGVEKQSTLTEQTQAHGLGWQTVDQWSQLQNGLAQFGLIKGTVDPTRYFDPSFQKLIYPGGKVSWP